MEAYSWRGNAKAVVAIVSGVSHLDWHITTKGSIFVCNTTHQASKTLRTNNGLHTWHIVGVVEVTNILSHLIILLNILHVLHRVWNLTRFESRVVGALRRSTRVWVLIAAKRCEVCWIWSWIIVVYSLEAVVLWSISVLIWITLWIGCTEVWATSIYIIWHHFYCWLINFWIFYSLVYWPCLSSVGITRTCCILKICSIFYTSVQWLKWRLRSLLLNRIHFEIYGLWFLDLRAFSFHVVGLISAISVILINVIHIYWTSCFNFL